MLHNELKLKIILQGGSLYFIPLKNILRILLFISKVAILLCLKSYIFNNVSFFFLKSIKIKSSFR